MQQLTVEQIEEQLVPRILAGTGEVKQLERVHQRTVEQIDDGPVPRVLAVIQSRTISWLLCCSHCRSTCKSGARSRVCEELVTFKQGRVSEQSEHPCASSQGGNCGRRAIHTQECEQERIEERSVEISVLQGGSCLSA